MQAQPMTSKEMQYISDSMTNEDLLMKQCAAAAALSSDQMVQQVCSDLIREHHRHYHTLLNALQQHANMAPNMPQQ